MKSAYELAMERLEKAQGPSKKLTDAQRERIAEIERQYEAKIAEEKLTYQSRMADAASVEERNTLQSELADRLQTLQSDCNKEKDAVWKAEP